MQYPVFSIITPTYKRPALLCRNIRSVINQTFPDYEHIIVDDDDNIGETGKAVSQFNDSRIRFLKNERSKGPAGAYNTGIINSKGRFLLFLDDDDEYYPEFLERMYRTFSAKPNVGFIWSGIMLVKESDTGSKSSEVIWPENIISTEKGIAIATSIGNGFGLCVRREVQDKIGLYDENLRVGSDTDFMIRLAMNYSFSVIPEVLVKIYSHGYNQLTSDANNYERIKVKEIILEKYKAFFHNHTRTLILQYCGYANLCYKMRLYKKGRKAMLSVIKIQPFRIRNFADFFSYELSGKSFVNSSFGKTIMSFLN
jgi:glycosyltransferase involved in cell wall biosynthesis